MRQFRITNVTSGVILGTYLGATSTDALNALAQDVGYRDYAAACAVAPAAHADLQVEQIAKAAPLDTLDKIKRANAAAGYCFFDPGTMRVFGSRVSERVYLAPHEERTYFVTSEKPYSGGRWVRRRYTVRAIDWGSARVETIGAPQQYSNGPMAHAAAERMAEERK